MFDSRIIHILLLAVTVIALAGCSGSGRVRYESPEEAYTRGKAYYDEGKYLRAIEYLQGAFDFGRAHEYAADSQLLLARAYSENGDYLLAANEYQRFIQIYRSDERVPQASFEYAMTFIDRSPGYQLDQTDTRRAVTELQLFMDRYPSSDKVAVAAEEIARLREKLGRKGFESAKLYERRELYESAAITYEAVFDKYPDTEWADDALLGAVRNFVAFASRSVAAKQGERYAMARANYDRLREIFPDSPYIEEARQILERSADLAAN